MRPLKWGKMKWLGIWNITRIKCSTGRIEDASSNFTNIGRILKNSRTSQRECSKKS
jgi:hypothetical protein